MALCFDLYLYFVLLINMLDINQVVSLEEDSKMRQFFHFIQYLYST